MLFTSTYGSAILTQPDYRVDSELLEALPPLPQDEDGPVFSEPWQAEAFALAVNCLSRVTFLGKSGLMR